MTIRWTKEELESFGYEEAADGSWRKKIQTFNKDNNSRAVPAVESSVRSGTKNAKKKGRGKVRETSNEREREDTIKRLHAPGATYAIIITAYRKRDIDPDGVNGKWYIDQAVDVGLIPDDSRKYIDFIITASKPVKTLKEERTEFEIWQSIIK